MLECQSLEDLWSLLHNESSEHGVDSHRRKRRPGNGYEERAWSDGLNHTWGLMRFRLTAPRITTHRPQSLSLPLSNAMRRATRSSTSPLPLRRALSPASASTLLPRFHPASLGSASAASASASSMSPVAVAARRRASPTACALALEPHELALHHSDSNIHVQHQIADLATTQSLTRCTCRKLCTAAAIKPRATMQTRMGYAWNIVHRPVACS